MSCAFVCMVPILPGKPGIMTGKTSTFNSKPGEKNLNFDNLFLD